MQLQAGKTDLLLTFFSIPFYVEWRVCIPTSTKTPKVTALVNDSPVTFVLDTDASVNIISGHVYNGLKHRPATYRMTTRLSAYRYKQAIPVRGFIDTTMKFRGKCCRAKIFLVDDESPLFGLQNLLSAHSTKALGMITFNLTFHVSVPIPDEFPSLFDGKMGKISGVIFNLHIESSVPPVMQQHRRIPFHVRKDIEAELKRLREMGVIEEVTGPIPWVSPVVVVPKKNKGVHIWIDIRKTNEAIQRIKHPMQTIDDLIVDLNGSTAFSKLYLSNAYHQLELGESSRHIRTFAIHAGLFRYKRLFFGVNAASELFQKAISDLLRGILGVKNFSDNIIYGRDQISHDSNLKSTLERLHNAGARLNREKCLFSVQELTFLVYFQWKWSVTWSREGLCNSCMWWDSSHTMPPSVSHLDNS